MVYKSVKQYCIVSTIVLIVFISGRNFKTPKALHLFNFIVSLQNVLKPYKL